SWLLSQVGFKDVGRVLKFGPFKWRQFRISRLQEQLKWDKRVHGSAYELCLYMFYEALLVLIYGSVMAWSALMNSFSKRQAALLYFFIFVCIVSRLFRLLMMLNRLTHYDREIPKVEAKLQALKQRQEGAVGPSLGLA
ncbi:MAG: hypothetical protein ACRD2D_00250, partial [Terriglobales bacterium]